jgi:guanylate kinase
MKFLIAGRTGTGKDTLRNILETEYGWKFVLSKTTRPKRFPEEDTHIFITKEEADNEPDFKVAQTRIANDNNVSYEYYTTQDQVMESDAYIIDPIGIETLLKNMPSQPFEIIYIKASDRETQKEMAIKRSNDPEIAEKTFEFRYNDENKQFSDFEESIEKQTFGNDNCQAIIPYVNDYRKETLDSIAFRLNCRKHYFENLHKLIEYAKERHLVNTKDGQILVATSHDKENPNMIPLSTEEFAVLLTRDSLSFQRLVEEWLSSPEVTV